MMHYNWRDKAFAFGVHPLDASWLSGAALAATCTLSRRELTGYADPKALFQTLAFEIETHDPHDARFAAAAWLKHVSLDAGGRQFVDLLIQDSLAADLTGQERMEVAAAILEAVINQDGYDIAPAVHDTICNTVPAARGLRVACLYPLSAPAALRLSAQSDVTLYCGNTIISVLAALLAHAVSGKLKVDRRDPIIGTYDRPALGTNRARADVVRTYDHVVTVPPLGWTGSDATSDTDRASTLEGRQFGYFKGNWRRSFTTIVSHALVDAAAPEVGMARLASSYGTVTAWDLPPAFWGGKSFARTSLVQLRTTTQF